MITKENYLTFVNHLKTHGFVFQNSEIYGGIANTWDYGPLGILIINNLKKYWLNFFITSEINNFQIDSKIIMNSKVWEASGHLKKFNDKFVENTLTNDRFRIDHLLKEHFPDFDFLQASPAEIDAKISQIKVHQNKKVAWSVVKEFNLMFETFQGIDVTKRNKVYLRPETAQGIFVNFKNVQKAMRVNVPFGIGQIGKSFRNEITPGNFIFRTREFEQMELEFFCSASQRDFYFDYYLQKMEQFLQFLGLDKNKIRLHVHKQEELAHYAKKTVDIEYQFIFGWGELWGICDRGSFDLTNHSRFSDEKFFYLDKENQKQIPVVIEPSVGVDRLLLAVLENSFLIENEGQKNQRLVLKIDKKIAPYKVAVLPLVDKYKNKATEIYHYLQKNDIVTTIDFTGSIGKKYRRQDAIGTPFCVTVDEKTELKNLVTIRKIETMEQIKEIEIVNLVTLIKKMLKE